MRQLKIKQTTTTSTTTTFITYNTNYTEKFVHPNLARLIELGGAYIKQLFNIKGKEKERNFICVSNRSSA